MYFLIKWFFKGVGDLRQLGQFVPYAILFNVALCYTCGMGLGNFTAKYHIKLSLFGNTENHLKLMEFNSQLYQFVGK